MPSPVSPRLYLAAALSGAAALMHEMVWTRDLSLYVGATWPAATVVVAGFMGGLGVGSFVGGRVWTTRRDAASGGWGSSRGWSWASRWRRWGSSL